MTEDLVEDEVRPLSATVLCVRYKGSADTRALTRRDLSGNIAAPDSAPLQWIPGSEVEWAFWLEYAGSRERALEVLAAMEHEFELVGPGADDFASALEVEEFSIGGVVE